MRMRRAFSAQCIAGLYDARTEVSYHKAITRNSGLLLAEGHVLSIGRPVAFAEGALRDAEGQLYATATSTLLVFERTHRPNEAE